MSCSCSRPRNCWLRASRFWFSCLTMRAKRCASAVGTMQAISLSQLAPKGNYVLIGGSPSDSNAKILHDAQMRVLKPLVDRGDIKIVSDTWTRDWDPAEAYEHMSAAIESTKGDIAAVVASND